MEFYTNALYFHICSTETSLSNQSLSIPASFPLVFVVVQQRSFTTWCCSNNALNKTEPCSRIIYPKQLGAACPMTLTTLTSAQLITEIKYDWKLCKSIFANSYTRFGTKELKRPLYLCPVVHVALDMCVNYESDFFAALYRVRRLEYGLELV